MKSMTLIFRSYNRLWANYTTSRGIVLLVTMVVLVVLAILGYTLSSRVAAQRHRDNFIIDYTAACYARDSALKYALSIVSDLNNFKPISRPNEPDFSDLFAMSEPDYRAMLENWAAELAKKRLEERKGGDNWFTAYNPWRQDDSRFGFDSNSSPLDYDSNKNDSNHVARFWDTNDLNNISDTNEIIADENDLLEQTQLDANLIDPNLLTIPGPYGPEWPYVIEPIEFEIDQCRIRIEIEDENAKFPLGWSILDDEKYKRESDASVTTFCEWMGFVPEQIDELKKQFKDVREKTKPFKVEFQQQTTRVLSKNVATRPPRENAATRPSRGTRPARQSTAYSNITLTAAQQNTKQVRDFARILHSSHIDTEMLARPTVVSEKRKESTLKYVSLWGTTKVNVNTAPRHVLEAAFTFGGQAQKIADEIIKKRRKQPFESIAQLKTELLPFSDNIERCLPFIDTTSDVFTIHVTATSGTAKATAIIVIFRVEGKPETITIMFG